MTKKQLIIAAVVAIILIGLIIAVSVYGKSKNSKVSDSQDISYPERRKIATSIENETNNSKIPEKSNSSQYSNSSSETSNPDSSLKSAVSSGGNLYQRTYKAASPETSGYPIPKSHHFFQIEGSLKPSDPDKAELTISLNIESKFEEQLQELEKTIQTILGPEITKEIIAYTRTKTNRDTILDKWWETNDKDIKIGSGSRTPIVTFYSWKK